MPDFAASLVTDKKFDASVSSLPILRRIFFDSFKNPKTITDYYKLKERQEQLHNDYKLTGEMPEEFDPALYKRIQKASKAMQKYSKQERAIMDNTKLSVDERKVKLTDIQKKKIELIKRLMKNSN